MTILKARSLWLAITVTFPASVMAMSTPADGEHLQILTATVQGMIAVIVFTCAYLLVIGEEFLHLRKSKPVILAAGIIWEIGRAHV